MTSEAQSQILFRWVQWLIIWVAVGIGGGRIITAQKDRSGEPLFSANDRSRWATVLALVHTGRFEIDDVIARNGKRTKWQTIDLVQHQGQDGKQYSYSSKPPLLPILLAGQYALIRASGLDLEEHTSYVIRLLLVTTNLIPFLVYLLVVRWLADRFAAHDLSRLFLLAAAAFGTYLSTFLITINNHLPAAFSIAIALACLWEVTKRDAPWWCYALTGCSAAFAVTNELPALSFFCLAMAVCLWRSPRFTLLAAAPAALFVAASFLAANTVAHGHWAPPYAHRRDGPPLGEITDASLDAAEPGALAESTAQGMATLVGDNALAGVECFRVQPQQGRISVQLVKTQQRFALLRNRGDSWTVHSWNNWYDYPNSYWMSDKKGVDRGEPQRSVYAFHVLFGHHGVFSLTPLFLLSLGGCLQLLRRPGAERGMGAAIALVSVVVLGFYIARPEIDRNYGGVTCAFRWGFWLIPLWLVAMAPMLDWLQARKWGRIVTLLLLVFSVASAQYGSANPWSQPWLFDFWTYLGWIHYG